MSYLDFKDARCKNCYKCLRECPVKAIKIIKHQARIIEDRCILCGNCTAVCPQNAKEVHSELSNVIELLNSNSKVIVSVAPSFISSFKLQDFSKMKIALLKLGFYDAQETAFGAKLVTQEYQRLLDSGSYKNFITSACPSVNRLISLYYPDALKYLAKVDTPMIAHAKFLKKDDKNIKVVFVGPCIAKKREGKESGYIDGVLTFEELKQLFNEKGIVLDDIYALKNNEENKNKSRFYPISRGIIKSFDHYNSNYEYIAVDGAENCIKVLSNIDGLKNMFIEMNMCDFGCINGPCSLTKDSYALKANADVRNYANNIGQNEIKEDIGNLDLSYEYKRIKLGEHIPSESEIKEILAKTGKFKQEDELNCGACGYPTCRDKAYAVANGYVTVEMCLPYMRERAESMSYEVIKNSPNGIMVVDYDLKIIEINDKAKSICGISDSFMDNKFVYDYISPELFFKATRLKQSVLSKKETILANKNVVEMNIIYSEKQRVMFAFMKDITKQSENEKTLEEMRLKTLQTTDEVIKKQMRVAQEIASLLGETTAETKVALLKLKKAIEQDKKE